MKHLLALAALVSAAAQAAPISGSLDFSADAWKSKATIELGSRLPAGLTVTGASLSFFIGPAGYTTDPASTGSYALQGQSVGWGEHCPANVPGWACEKVTNTYQRERVTVMHAMGQSATATLGTASVSADNRGETPRLSSQPGARTFDEQQTHGVDVDYGHVVAPDGTVVTIPGYRTVVDDYFTQEVTQRLDLTPLMLSLDFDAASLAALNRDKSFAYTLWGSGLWGSLDLRLNYTGVLNAVPEPGSAAILATGLMLLGAARRRRAA